MSLYKSEWSGPQCGWALWHVSESEDELTALSQPDRCPDNIVSPLKRLEWLAGRVLLRTLAEKAGLSYQGLLKDEFGKPSLDQHSHHISLSHSFPYVAAQIDYEAVGIDVEQPKEKLLRIAPRVFNLSEEKDAGKNIIKNCVYWCAKEALYKIHGLGGISFSKNLRIDPFILENRGVLSGNISIEGKNRFVTLGYSVEKDFVLVFTQNQGL